MSDYLFTSCSITADDHACRLLSADHCTSIDLKIITAADKSVVLSGVSVLFCITVRCLYCKDSELHILV